MRRFKFAITKFINFCHAPLVIACNVLAAAANRCRRDRCRLNRLRRPLSRTVAVGCERRVATARPVVTRVLFLDHRWPLNKNKNGVE